MCLGTPSAESFSLPRISANTKLLATKYSLILGPNLAYKLAMGDLPCAYTLL